MKSRALVILGIILAVAGLLLLSFWGKLEWSEQTVWSDYSGEANTNNFLATQRVLTRLGKTASSVRGLPSTHHTMGPGDILILPRRYIHLTDGQVESIMDWVKEGGLLIAVGTSPESREESETQDPLFSAIGARATVRNDPPKNGTDLGEPEPKPNPKPGLEPPEPQKSDNSASETAQDAYADANRVTTVLLDGRVYRVELGEWLQLLDLSGKATKSIGNNSGVKLLQYEVEKGRVVLCTELDCLNNWKICEYDHTDFLWALVSKWGSQNRVWIVYREEPPSLRQWIRDYAWMVVVSLVTLILASLWHAGSRFGPRTPEPALGRRSLLEHLAACGRFQWSKHEGLSLLKAAREATIQKIHRVHPGWAHLAPQELCTRLAQFSGLEELRILRALRHERLSDPREFTEAIQTLDLIRKKL